MLKNHEPYHDLGADFYERQEKEGKVKSCLKKLYKLGVKNHEPYHDLGADFYERQEKEGKVKSCLKKLYKLGVDLTGSQIDLMTGKVLLQT